MTLQELLDASPFCDSIEVIVRKEGHGMWIQGYRIGKNANIYPSEITAELRELKGLKEYGSTSAYLDEGEEVDVKIGSHLPMKVICKDCHKLPNNIANLEVCSIQPRHIAYLHKDIMTHNEYSLEVFCYPDNYVTEKRIETKEDANLIGQMDIFGYLESEE